MRWLATLHEKRKERRYRRAIARIRRELAWWGIDVSNLTDQELADGICGASAMIASVGVTTQQAVEGAQLLSRAMRRFG